MKIRRPSWAGAAWLSVAGWAAITTFGLFTWRGSVIWMLGTVRWTWIWFMFSFSLVAVARALQGLVRR